MERHFDRELESLKSEMIRMASHDLRNPLNVIVLHARLLSRAVRDDAELAESVSEILAAPDFVVAAAADGESGLAQLVDSEFDVVLVDKLMPRMSGDRLCFKAGTDGSWSDSCVEGS